MSKKFVDKSILLLVQVFIVSSCSLCYELIISTGVANITGNSVLAFSLSIGLFLAGLGTGAFSTKWIKDKHLSDSFIWTETVLALVGGISVVLLYLSLVFTPYFQMIQIGLTFIIGFTSGLEIPILTRILNQNGNRSSFDPEAPRENNNDEKLGVDQDQKEIIQQESNYSYSLKGILANVLSFDYLGGLAASIMFPLILLPYFGLVQLGFITGLINLSMALLGLWIFWGSIKHIYLHVFTLILVGIVLVSGAFYSSSIYNFIESGLYRDPIVYSEQSIYQRIVLTKKGNDTRMYLNGGIQFSSQDEYRYHESLVIPLMLAQGEQKKDLKIVIFGGGDGLAVRQLQKFNQIIESITVVDIDSTLTNLSKYSRLLTNINENSLMDEKVKIVNLDAWKWIQEQPRESIDLIFSDLPDPDDTSIAKLYSQEFFKFSKKALKENGYLVTQSSSPYTTPKVFWSQNKTLSSVFPQVIPYQAYVPSFGLWGFNLVSKQEKSTKDVKQTIIDQSTVLDSNTQLSDLRFLNSSNIRSIFELGPDIKKPKLSSGEMVDLGALKINTLDNLILVKYYTETGQESLI